jgi:low temperature requirement protein LtrA
VTTTFLPTPHFPPVLLFLAMVLMYDPPVLTSPGPLLRKQKKNMRERFESLPKKDKSPLDDPLLFEHESDPHHEHKSASWPELFGDLVFVSIIAELSHLAIAEYSSDSGHHRRLLGGDDGDHNVYPFDWKSETSTCLAMILYGCMAWNNWILDMSYTTRFEKGNDIIGRFLSFAFMCCMVIFAGSVGTGFTRAYNMKCSTIAHGTATLLTILKYYRGICHNDGKDGRKDATALKKIMLPMLVDSSFYFIAGYEASLERLESAIYLCMTALLLRHFLVAFNWLVGGLEGEKYYKMATEFDPHYVTERFGLIMIIVLGESVLSVIAGVENSFEGNFDKIIIAFTVVFSNWWIYFDNLSENVVTYHVRGWLVVQAHQVLLISNCFIAAGLAVVLSNLDSTDPIKSGPKGLLFFSYAVVCYGQFLCRIVSAWSLGAMKANKKVRSLPSHPIALSSLDFQLTLVIALPTQIFALRWFEAAVFVGFLIAFPFLQFDPSNRETINIVAIISVLRVIVDAISTYRDFYILTPFWEAENLLYARPLLKEGHYFRGKECSDQEIEDFFRHSNYGNSEDAGAEDGVSGILS